jgi:hypothetical protein
VVNIHKSLGNADRLRHHRWVILDKIKGGSKRGDGGDSFMNKLFQYWQQLSFFWFPLNIHL